MNSSDWKTATGSDRVDAGVPFRRPMRNPLTGKMLMAIDPIPSAEEMMRISALARAQSTAGSDLVRNGETSGRPMRDPSTRKAAAGGKAKSAAQIKTAFARAKQLARLYAVS